MIEDTSTRATWDADTRNFLLDGLLTQSCKSKRANGSGWKREAWEAIRKELNSKFNRQLTVNQLKEAFNNLKEYQVVKGLRNLSGFGWDEEKSRVTAEPDVWNAFLENRPAAAKYRTKSFLYYDKMHELCADRMPMGRMILYPTLLRGMTLQIHSFRANLWLMDG
jgi:Myb/SANT-like DNA-binding domain